jgi:DNA mismatch endonuclease Vsr
MSESPRPRFDDVSLARRRNLAAVAGKDTGPELRVRRLLHRLGYRFRLHRRDLPGTPDIVLAGRRKIVEVRGCFWHRHPDPACRNAILPKVRADWWSAKLARNVARDKQNLAALLAAGWSVLVLWECELKDENRLTERLRSFLA